jgi:uroporphyrinogen-III decarboxylase
VRAGRKIVFVSDGNIDAFLERLLALPVAGLMFENPATPFERVLDTWGEAGRGFIGGIDTALVTRASPDAVAAHARDVIERGRRYPGFVLSSCGGLYGDVPMENLLAYFRTRDRPGIPAEG